MIVRLPSRTGDRSRTPSGGYVRLFDPLGGTVVRLPWMPEEIETSNVAQAWSEVPRPGRVPLLLSSGKNLPKVSLPFRLVNAGHASHVEGTIDALEKLARSSNPVRLDVAQQFRGMYRITALSKRETAWDVTGKVTDAEITLELTRSSDMVVAVGPIKRKTKKSKRGGSVAG
jgi:phage protein U